MATLVDSSVWIDFFNGRSTPAVSYLDRSLGRRSFLVGDLVLAEVLQGFQQDREFQKARDALLRFPIVEISDQEIALRSALNYRRLRRLGLTVRGTVDCLIATYCIENGCSLLSSDRDFSLFAEHLDLELIDPSLGPREA